MTCPRHRRRRRRRHLRQGTTPSRHQAPHQAPHRAQTLHHFQVPWPTLQLSDWLSLPGCCSACLSPIVQRSSSSCPQWVRWSFRALHRAATARRGLRGGLRAARSEAISSVPTARRPARRPRLLHSSMRGRRSRSGGKGRRRCSGGCNGLSGGAEDECDVSSGRKEGGVRAAAGATTAIRRQRSGSRSTQKTQLRNRRHSRSVGCVPVGAANAAAAA
mmetsp:Transcript_35696/g.105505  ORF Transcript_35696/g.105505 Transcript_35696/m.105505 type:complete len:217 (-) Transcript_35696:180-830(-)